VIPIGASPQLPSPTSLQVWPGPRTRVIAYDIDDGKLINQSGRAPTRRHHLVASRPRLRAVLCLLLGWPSPAAPDLPTHGDLRPGPAGATSRSTVHRATFG
jgi:hypothetical protein